MSMKTIDENENSNCMSTRTWRRGGEFIEGDEEHFTNTNDWIAPHVASNKYKHLHARDGAQRQKKRRRELPLEYRVGVPNLEPSHVVWNFKFKQVGVSQ
jgi:hypothetical protein